MEIMGGEIEYQEMNNCCGRPARFQKYHEIPEIRFQYGASDPKELDEFIFETYTVD